MENWTADLQRMVELRAAGILSEEDFQRAKQRLLRGETADAAGEAEQIGDAASSSADPPAGPPPATEPPDVPRRQRGRAAGVGGDLVDHRVGIALAILVLVMLLVVAAAVDRRTETAAIPAGSAVVETTA